MPWDTGLTGTARVIAETEECPLRVMAGPGTGKSYAMKRRVARLLESGEAPERILAVTFTRNAAASLVEDLHTLGVANCEDVRVGTLHAFCFSLLLEEEVFDYLDRVPRPLLSFNKSGVMQFESGVMLDDIVLAGNFGGKRDCTRRIRAFESAWARLQSETPGWPRDAVDRQFNTVLIDWLRFHKAMLVGELVPETLRFLRNNPTADILSAFDHVIVDEYQDLNKAEQELIDLLAGEGDMAIVGDVDQSIYSFRHANPEGIETFNEQHATTHDETLAECRRCPTRVVGMANYMICQNHNQQGVCRLQSKADNPEGIVRIVQWNTVAEETENVANYISHMVAMKGYAPKDILVLTPRRLLGYALRDRLSGLGVPVHSFYQEEALEGGSAQVGYILLSLIVNPEDRVALRWWLGEEHASGRASDYARLRLHCEQAGISPREALDAVAQGAVALPRMNGLLTRYGMLTAKLAQLQGLGLPELVDALFPDNDSSCRILRDVAVLALSDVDDAEKLFGRIKAHVTQPEVPEDVDYTRIMSLHKSKGLTSKVVIVTGCSQGMIPNLLKDGTPEERAASLKEQRRLFYVAITRCTEVLVISSALRMERKLGYKIGARLRPGRSAEGVAFASQFLAELGPEAPAPVAGQAWVASGYE